MKKKCLATILFMVMVFSMNGCGNSNVENTAETPQQEIGLSDEDVEELYEDSEETEEEPTSAIDDLLQFEVTDEVKNSDFSQGYIQVADVVIPAMSTVGDIISLLENSSLEWEYEYNPDQLVLYLEPGERIDVYYKGMEMFTIKSNNYMGDESTISLKDCLVTTIDVNEDNSQFFYYSKGYSGNGANVEDYTTFSNTYKDYDGYDESPSGDTISVKFHMPYATQQIESMGIDFGDQPLWVFANFSTADGTCVSFSYGDSLGFSWDKIE